VDYVKNVKMIRLGKIKMNETDKQTLWNIERAQEIERLYLSTDCIDVYSEYMD